MRDKEIIEEVITNQQGSDAAVVKSLHLLLVERLLAYLEGTATLESVFHLSETLYSMEVLKSSIVVRKALERLHELKGRIEKKEKLSDEDHENITYMLNSTLNDLT